MLVICSFYVVTCYISVNWNAGNYRALASKSDYKLYIRVCRSKISSERRIHNAHHIKHESRCWDPSIRKQKNLPIYQVLFRVSRLPTHEIRFWWLKHHCHWSNDVSWDGHWDHKKCALRQWDPEESVHKHSKQLAATALREQVAHSFAQVFEEKTALFDAIHDRCEFVVHQKHVCCPLQEELIKVTN